MESTVAIGLEVCAQQRPKDLNGSRFGLLMNQASIDHQFRYACDVLAELYPQQLTALFSPQHGLWGEQQANMIESSHTQHPRLQIPVYSLYSETRHPTADMLADLDCLVGDLQDVGTRVYTFIWTVKHCLESCAENGIPVIVLDRPNPLGNGIEGPLLEPEYCSFVGEACIPMRHGLTIGEMALLLNAEEEIGADLSVIPMQGWKRSDTFAQLSRPWIPPSPNLPRWESAMAYPGQVLFEGTNLSEGRGTTRPFEIVGAPYVDPEQLCDSLKSLELPGIAFLPIRFIPTADKWDGQSCGGVSLHITDASRFLPYRTSVAILGTIIRSYPGSFEWLPPPYEYETEKWPIDIISGGSTLREQLEKCEPLSEERLTQLAHVDRETWMDRVEPHLLYEA